MVGMKRSATLLEGHRNKAMRVAITGGSGFLGQEVIRMMEGNSGITPIVIGRAACSGDRGYEYRATDYSVESLSQVLMGVDAVIHLAAVRGVNNSISEFHPNELITENLLKSCVELGIANIVYASSISVYSDVKKIPWTEKQIPWPKTMYGISKLSCEYLGDLFHRRHGLKVKSLRFAHLLGEGERKGYMMNTFIDRAFNKQSLKVIGKSQAKREFVYIKDAARAIILALNKPEYHGSLNIGSNKAHSNLEIARIVNECFDNIGNLSYQDDIDEGIESSLMDSSKAGQVLGYYPEYDLRRGLLDIKKQKLEGVKSV